MTGLSRVAAQLHDNPRFLAGWCAVRPGAFQVLVAALGLDQASAARLMVCGVPRPDRYQQDVMDIANVIGVVPDDLADALREAAVVAELLQGVL